MSNIDNTFGFDGDTDMGLEEAPGIGIGVIRIAKRDYAVGLQWNAVEQPTKAAAEARNLASQSHFSADFFCVRQGSAPQFGLGTKLQGHKRGMPSLAAHVAQARSGSWIGLFEVPEGFYVVAVRDDGILSECDRFFADADVARNHFENFQNQSDWNEAIAPEDFGIPGTVAMPIEQLIEGRAQVRLQEVSRSSNLIKLALGGLAIGGLIVGVMFYLDHLEESRLWEIAQEQARTATSVISPQEEEITIPPMPWEFKPMGVHVLAKCYEETRKFPRDIPGWVVDHIVCEGEGIAAALDRDGTLGAGGGSFNWIGLMVNREGFTPAIIPPNEGSGSRVAVQWNLEGIPKIPVDLDTAPVNKMKMALLAVMEERMTPVTFLERGGNEFWQGFGFSFSTQENPIGFTDVLEALPGVMMDRIRFDIEDNIWHLEGTVYEQLPLPQQQ